MNIEQELEKLKKLYENKQYKQMLEKIQELLLIAEDPKLYHMRGLAKYMLLDYEGAIKDYDKAIELDPSYTNAYFNRAYTKNDIGYYEDAIQDYTKVIELNPNDTSAYFYRGSINSNIQNYEEAIEDFNKAIELKPNNAKAYCNRGLAKHEIKEYKSAIEDYTKAIELDSNDTYAYYNRGNTKFDLQDYKGALEDYTNAIKLDPNDTKSYYNRGNAKGALNNIEDAIQDYNKAIELNPDYIKTYLTRGTAKGALNNQIGAIEDFTKVIELAPNNADAYFHRGIAKGVLKDFIGEIEDYSKAIELNPNFEDAYYYRGNVKCNISDYEGGIEDYNKAIQLNPYNYNYYTYKGYAYAGLRNFDVAIECFYNAYRVNSNEKSLKAIKEYKIKKQILSIYNKFIIFRVSYKLKVMIFLICSIIGTFILSQFIPIRKIYILCGILIFSAIFDFIVNIFINFQVKNLCKKIDRLYTKDYCEVVENIDSEFIFYDNINEMALEMKNQAIELVPEDLSVADKNYLADKVYANCKLSYEALTQDSTIGFDEDTIVLISQIVTEWTFHKCVDLSRSEISREYWDEIMQKIAFAVYEIAKKGFLKNIEQQRILDTVEQNVKKVWEEEIDDLVSQNKLSKEAGNKAKQLSNIDDMAKREG